MLPKSTVFAPTCLNDRYTGNGSFIYQENLAWFLKICKKMKHIICE